MITGLRSTFFLMASFLFFLIILGILGLSTMMRPGQWHERSRSTRY